jgi:8-oxo-dGTP diphosphatase
MGSVSMQREYPTQPFAAVSVVVMKNKSVLLIKRAHDPKTGYYSVPGGVVDLGEKFEDAAIREVEEETGIKIKIERLIDVIDNITQDENGVRFHYVLIGVLAKAVGGTFISSNESLDTRWVPFDELTNYPLTNTATHFFKKLEILPKMENET